MPDTIDAEFEAWWAEWITRNHKTLALVTPDRVKAVAHKAWTHGRRCMLAESLDTMVSVTEAPEKAKPIRLTNCRTGRTRSGLTTEEMAQRDWEQGVAEMREAVTLAKRHGLAITSATQGRKNEVQALRSGDVIAEAGSWAEIIETLKRMEKEGKL